MFQFMRPGVLFALIGFVLLASNSRAGSVDPNGFDKNAYYTITSAAKGKKLAITFLVPADLKSAKTTSSSDTKVSLNDLLKKTDDTQKWQIHFSNDSYLIYAKISDDTERLTGIMKP